MAAKKRSTRAKKKGTRKGIVPPQIRSLVSFLAGPGRPLLIGSTILGLFVFGCVQLWHHVRADVLTADQYRVTPDRIEITDLPPWIHSDLRTRVFQYASFDESLSILDRDLAERLAEAFAMHPWVAEVHRVTKRHPARVQVDLTYRKPLCVVELAGQAWQRPIPVDIEGVILPEDDFSDAEMAGYPRLVGIESAPLGPLGTRWGDIRVVDAAEIAAAFGPEWQRMGLDRILPVSAGQGRYRYHLLTRGGSEILWGFGPSNDEAREPSATDKVARLKKYFAKHGSLEGLYDRTQTLNVLDL